MVYVFFYFTICVSFAWGIYFYTCYLEKQLQKKQKKKTY